MKRVYICTHRVDTMERIRIPTYGSLSDTDSLSGAKRETTHEIQL